MRRSSKLVRGDWWRIFGITLLTGVMAGIAAYVIQLPLSLVQMLPGAIGSSDLGSDPTGSQVMVYLGGAIVLSLVSQLIGQVVVAAFPQLIASLLYIDRRIRTENLAPTLAEAAAVPPAY
ncbi:hypothetical protein [Streptomyces sp. NBC_01481]|uniref:hypothetical protein n=1 Tax=Streptomyces sp. NBC_01481 TaxID=2975869 RepID=UPI002256EABD|nr:hypothetical protein [Streptomyces sp. NBC_01481]MCX4582978.1 hypothetical protein [Streptomyces sp. NBC_01481]